MTHEVPADVLAKLHALYGDDWHLPLAKAALRDARTALRWKAGDSPMPKQVLDWVRRRRVP